MSTKKSIDQSLMQCIQYKQLPETLELRTVAIMLRAYVLGLIENWLFMPDSFDLKAKAPQFADSFIDMIRLSPALQTNKF